MVLVLEVVRVQQVEMRISGFRYSLFSLVTTRTGEGRSSSVSSSGWLPEGWGGWIT